MRSCISNLNLQLIVTSPHRETSFLLWTDVYGRIILTSRSVPGSFGSPTMTQNRALLDTLDTLKTWYGIDGAICMSCMDTGDDISLVLIVKLFSEEGWSRADRLWEALMIFHHPLLILHFPTCSNAARRHIHLTICIPEG